MDSNVQGGAEGDTFYHLVKMWNARPDHRGNGEGANEKYDSRQFFQLDLQAIPAAHTNSNRKAEPALSVNQAIFRWASPFRPRLRWTGALTEADAVIADGGVLIGANLQLPLRAGGPGEPVFVGVKPGYVRVNVGEARQYKAERGFAIYEKDAQIPIFKIDTISDAIGARLLPASGDFDLFVNGCRLMVGYDCEKNDGVPAEARGSAPPIRLDDGDVIAYALPDSSGKRIPRHVFVYSHAQLGAFSHLAWANGRFARFYPQGETWTMAHQITQAISNITQEGSPLANQDVGLTIDAQLNHEVYVLLRRWRGCLEGTTPSQRCCIGAAPGDQCGRGESPSVRKAPIPPKSSRNMAVTLMDTDTGALLALASDTGTPSNPNSKNPVGLELENINLLRHRIGSAIKPFTAAATLRAFPDLRTLTVVDQRNDKTKLLGLPFDGKRELLSHALDGDGAIAWKDFLPKSDNLYAATLTLLGTCKSEGTVGLPHFRQMRNPQPPLRLVLTDNGTNLGSPIWAFDNMYDPNPADDWRAIDLIHKTPLADQLAALFDVRTREPQVASYATDMWLPVTATEHVSKHQVFNTVSPEIPNFAFPDLVNYSDLRSVVLGGEFGYSSLSPYGRIGSAWSNVFLAQSFARISTGRKVMAHIVATPQQPRPEIDAWFENALTSPWRLTMLHELEGVGVEQSGTAHRAINSTLMRIAGSRPQYTIGSHQRAFTVVSKTGTLDPDGRGPLLEDSTFVFTAGIWDDSLGRFEKGVTGAIYVEQGNEGQAQAFAAALLSLLNGQARFHWNQN
jgi:hypothetical protein